MIWTRATSLRPFPTLSEGKKVEWQRVHGSRQMKRWFEFERTLRPGGWLNSTLGMSFLFLLLFLATGEAIARSEVVRSTFIVPSLGSEHGTLEEQMSRIEAYASRHELIDCIFLGDSTVMSDFNPVMFEKAYHDQTGNDINCFNFGIGASTVVSSAALAQILVNDYRPRLLIFGIDALNFTVPSDEGGAAALLETPWVRYKLGQLSFEGWLYDHSYLYRYSNTISQLIMSQTSYREISAGGPELLSDDYFYPTEDQGPFDMATPPNPDSKHPYDEHYFAELGNFQLLPANLDALDQIADLQGETTQVLAIEMPVSDTYYYYFEHGELEYLDFIAVIRERLFHKKVQFVETNQLNLFSNDNWFNRNHLNEVGAGIFSRWFGQQLGTATQEITLQR